MQSLYLKIHSDRISVETSKIQTKQRQIRPYARSLQENLSWKTKNVSNIFASNIFLQVFRHTK